MIWSHEAYVFYEIQYVMNELNISLIVINRFEAHQVINTLPINASYWTLVSEENERLPITY